VANIIGRAEILALFISLLFFLELTRGEKIKSQWRAGLWFFLALGSKETAIAALPIAIFILHIQEVDFFLGKIFRKYFHLIVSLITGLLVYFGLRFMVLGNSHFLGVKTSLVENPLMFVSDQDRIFTALKILWLYFTKIFWPLNLCSDYSYNQITTLHTFLNHETILGLVVLLFFLISIFIFWKRIPLLSLAAAFFLFSFLPVSNLIFPIGTIAGERLMYYPSVGISLFLAYLIFSLIKIRTKPIFGYFILTSFLTLMMFYGSVSYLRANDWLTEKNLFISAAKCAPNSVLSRSNLGAIYYLNGNLKTAKEELLNAQKIYPNYSKGVNNLGLVYWKEGDREKARQLFLQAANSEFPYTGAYENLAMLNLEEDNSDEARQWLNKLYSNNGALVDNYIATWIAQKKTK
jgi:Flp pilus assembly protein TadD